MLVVLIIVIIIILIGLVYLVDNKCGKCDAVEKLTVTSECCYSTSVGLCKDKVQFYCSHNTELPCSYPTNTNAWCSCKEQYGESATCDSNGNIIS